VSRAALLVGAVVLGLLASGGGAVGASERGVARNRTAVTVASQGALPSPVPIRAEPEGVALGDPAFTPVPGARADYGRLGGTVYEIEIPEHWNHKLVLFMHGFGELAPVTRASPPHIRRYLIDQGYAWGSSSFSSTSLIPGRAADETAALWDLFARRYGRPVRTYLTGTSMGGQATNIAAERYGDRFDGGLALCGASGQTSAVGITTNFFVAAAWAAGVTQAEYDASPGVSELIHQRIQPALRDASVHRRFEDMVISLTGGPRAFDRPGFEIEEPTNWHRAELSLSAGLAENRDVRYPDPAFDRQAIRLHTNAAARQAFLAGSETTGHLEMPLLTLHTTGDEQVPINEAQLYQREVDAAGSQHRMVQRVMRDPGHCGFTDDEEAASFEALVAWVERGHRPSGTNVLTHDLRHLDRTYERLPRPGTPEGNTVPGAQDRVVFHGALTVDGQPADARYLGAIVVDRGLSTACQLTLPQVTGGRFAITVMGNAESAGCGAPGARVYLWVSTDSGQLYSRDGIAWPRTGRSVSASVNFLTQSPAGSAPPTVIFAGAALRPDGRYLLPGTRVEAYIGRTRCGVASTRRTGSFSGFILSVAGPDSVAACSLGAPVTFRVAGRLTPETAVNAARSGNAFDLTLAG
jgi:hypothetical protein